MTSPLSATPQVITATGSYTARAGDRLLFAGLVGTEVFDLTLPEISPNALGATIEVGVILSPGTGSLTINESGADTLVLAGHASSFPLLFTENDGLRFMRLTALYVSGVGGLWFGSWLDGSASGVAGTLKANGSGNNLAIFTLPGVTAGNAGGALAINTAAGGPASGGGDILIEAGPGGDYDSPNPPGAGGNLLITGGAGGAGDGGANPLGGAGSALTVVAGAGGVAGGTGGQLEVRSGDGSAGDAGLAVNGGAGGLLRVVGAPGGAIIGSTSSDQSGTGGTVEVTGGIGGTVTGTDGEALDGGAVAITGGAGGENTAAAGDGGSGGSVAIYGGTGGTSVGGLQGDGGNVEIDAGAGSDNGVVSLGVLNAEQVVVGRVAALVYTRHAVTAINHTNSPYTMLAGESLRVTSTGGTVTVNLPDAATNEGTQLVIVALTGASNTVTISASGSDTVNGAASITITTNRGRAVLESDGADWAVIG